MVIVPAAIAVSMEASASSDPRRVCINIRKINGETFGITMADPKRTRVSDLKRSISMQESIASDCFDLATGDEVLWGPSLGKTLKEARIADGDTLNLVMKESSYPKDLPRCLQCKAPHPWKDAVELCRDCHMQQVRLLQRYEGYQDDARLAERYARLASARLADESSDDES